LRKPLFSCLPVCGSKALKVSICVPLCPSGHGARKSAGGCFFLAKENTRQAFSLTIFCVYRSQKKTRQKGIDRVSAWRSRFAFQRLLGNGVFINRETLTASASLSDGGAESATEAAAHRV